MGSLKISDDADAEGIDGEALKPEDMSEEKQRELLEKQGCKVEDALKKWIDEKVADLCSQMRAQLKAKNVEVEPLEGVWAISRVTREVSAKKKSTGQKSSKSVISKQYWNRVQVSTDFDFGAVQFLGVMVDSVTDCDAVLEADENKKKLKYVPCAMQTDEGIRVFGHVFQEDDKTHQLRNWIFLNGKGDEVEMRVEL